jgi:hypothetical protein
MTYQARCEIGRALNLGEWNPHAPLPSDMKPNTAMALCFYTGQRMAMERDAAALEHGRGIPADVRMLMETGLEELSDDPQ